MGIISPISNPTAWDVVILGGTKSPGLAKVGEWKRAYEWDKKKGKGTSGEQLTFVQKPAASGSITFYLWTDAHFAAWDTFILLLKYDPTKSTKQAVTIFHPSLAFVDITSVLTEKIGNPIPVSLDINSNGNQIYSIPVDFVEFNPPPPIPAVSTPTNAAGGTGNDDGKTKPNAQDAQQAEIAALLQEAQS